MRVWRLIAAVLLVVLGLAVGFLEMMAGALGGDPSSGLFLLAIGAVLGFAALALWRRTKAPPPAEPGGP